MPNQEENLYDKDLWRRRPIVKINGTWTVDGRPRTQYKILRVERPSNIPGKVFVAVLITLPPNSATPPHSHNGAAVYAQVVKGEVISQMVHEEIVGGSDNDGRGEMVEHDSGVGVYRSGEMWYEAPGCHHVRSENAGEGEAQFFANFVVDEEVVDERDEGSLAGSLTVLDVEGRSPFYEGGRAGGAGGADGG